MANVAIKMRRDILMPEPKLSMGKPAYGSPTKSRLSGVRVRFSISRLYMWFSSWRSCLSNLRVKMSSQRFVSTALLRIVSISRRRVLARDAIGGSKGSRLMLAASIVTFTVFMLSASLTSASIYTGFERSSRYHHTIGCPVSRDLSLRWSFVKDTRPRAKGSTWVKPAARR